MVWYGSGLEEVHSLPGDGNKYDLIPGQLFVTRQPLRTTSSLRPACAELWSTLNIRPSEARADREDVLAERELIWHPADAAEPLRIAVADVFT